MTEGFHFGIKVKLDNEYGVVIKPEILSDWDNEPGLIRWDTADKNDIEDWRGLFGSFVDAGGVIVNKNHEFIYITNSGQLK